MPRASYAPALSTDEEAILASLNDDQKLAVAHAIRLACREVRAAAIADLLAALTDLWQWATEARTHLDTDPVPDGLGAMVIAALAKAEATNG